MDKKINVPKRILATLINSVSAGVVPRIGAPYMAIGRKEEISALLSDFQLAENGGSSMRFIIGRYGSGKSFLIQLVKGYALEKGFVCADGDLSPERRLCGGRGMGLATYRELIGNMSTKTSSEGGALVQIITKWLSSIQGAVAAEGVNPENPLFSSEVSKRVFSFSRRLENSVGGFDFAAVINMYYQAYISGDDEKESCCMRWLRGEYSTKTEAKRDLSVGSVIDDENWYDYIKLWAEFVQMIGYKGFVVFIDECVNLYKISNRISRESNYEKILSIFNDTLQGRARGLSVILGGTPQFLEDTRRGLFSYEALRSRLADGRFSDKAGFRDMQGPVIRLKKLSDNELFALLSRMTVLHGEYFNWKPAISEEEIAEFLRDSMSRIGSESMITPREIIRDYMSLLNILLNNPGARVKELLGSNIKVAGREISSQELDLDTIEI